MSRFITGEMLEKELPSPPNAGRKHNLDFRDLSNLLAKFGAGYHKAVRVNNLILKSGDILTGYRYSTDFKVSTETADGVLEYFDRWYNVKATVLQSKVEKGTGVLDIIINDKSIASKKNNRK